MITQEVVQKIRNIVGKEHTLDSDLDRFGYSYDSSFVPLFPASMPDLVVRPRTTEEVSEVMKIAYANAIPVTARGTASGRTGGSIPLKGGIVLCLDRMTSVIELDQKNMMITVEAGEGTGDIKNICAQKSKVFTPELGSFIFLKKWGKIYINVGGVWGV